MGEALSQWIDGSLAALENIQAERDRQSERLDSVRQTASSHRAAVGELDREVAKLQEERKRHTEKLRELDEQIATQADALDGLEGDIRTMTGALEAVAQGENIPTAVRKPKAAPNAKSQAAPMGVPAPVTSSPATPGGKPSPASTKPSSAAPKSTASPTKPGPNPDSFATPAFVMDDLSESIDRVPRSPWRRVVIAGIALTVVGGAGLAAVRTGLVTDVIDRYGLGSVFK